MIGYGLACELKGEKGITSVLSGTCRGKTATCLVCLLGGWLFVASYDSGNPSSCCDAASIEGVVSPSCPLAPVEGEETTQFMTKCTEAKYKMVSISLRADDGGRYPMLKPELVP